MSVLHDIAEAITGDIAPADNVTTEEKQRREREAIAALTANLGGFSGAGSAAVNALVHDYEARESADAIAVKDLDRLEMIVQVSVKASASGTRFSSHGRYLHVVSCPHLILPTGRRVRGLNGPRPLWLLRVDCRQVQDGPRTARGGCACCEAGAAAPQAKGRSQFREQRRRGRWRRQQQF